MAAETVLFDGNTSRAHYLVVDTVYEGRLARVLYSGHRAAAQSGVARDGQPDLLFDYNQRFMELVASLLPSRLLLIGGGAYTLPMALLPAFPQLKIDVVEIDPGLQEIAERFFGLQPDPRLNIIHGEGRQYLNGNQQAYDLILIDAFAETAIPKSLATLQAVQQVYRGLSPNGVAAVNIISPYYGQQADIIKNQVAAYSSIFRGVKVYPAGRSLFSLWLPQNLVLVAQKGRAHELQLRYGPLGSPEA